MKKIDRNDSAVDQEVLRIEIVVGTDCGVAVGFVHDLMRISELGCWALSEITFIHV